MNRQIEIQNLINNIKKNDVKSKDLNIFEIFESENFFTIKEFQRKYEWRKLQIKELLKELDENRGNNVYFLGTIILKKEKTLGNEINLCIVDGQQRITTLFLILKCLEDKIKKHRISENIKIIIKEIKNVYISNDKTRLKISYSRGKEELKNILLHNNFDNFNEKRNDFKNNKYYQAYNIILDFLENKKYIEDLEEFYEKIKKIKFSIVMLGTEIDEYKTFEDLNSKGVDLEIDDLTRNYFAQKASKLLKNNDKVKEYIDKYEKLLNDVEIFLKNEKKQFQGFFGQQIARWFKNYVLYKTNYENKLSDRNDKRIYLLYKEDIDNKITKSTDLLEEIKMIEEYLSFCKFINKNETNEFYLINEISFYPIFFEIYKNAKTNDKNKKMLNKIFTIIYLATILKNKDTKNFNKDHLENVKETFLLNSNFEKSIEIIFDFMKYKDNTVREIINKKILEDSKILDNSKFKKFVEYFFAKMIENITKKEIFLNSNDYVISNIIPDEYEFSKMKKEKEKEKMMRLVYDNSNKLKNLILIENKLNKEIENNLFYNKVKKFNWFIRKNNCLETTKKIFKNNKFEDQELKNRFNEIKDFAPTFLNELLKWKKDNIN